MYKNKNDELSEAQQRERLRRSMVASRFNRAQQGSHQDLHRKIDQRWSPRVQDICNTLINISQRLNRPRPELNNQKKRADQPDSVQTPQNKPNSPRNVIGRAELQQVQKEIHELSDAERGNIALFGASLPGSIRNVVQQFVTGNSKGSANFSNLASDNELIGGPRNMDDSLSFKAKTEMRSLAEGGQAPEVELADQRDLGLSNPCKMELTPNH